MAAQPATMCIFHLAGSVCSVVSLSLLLSFHVGQISFSKSAKRNMHSRWQQLGWLRGRRRLSRQNFVRQKTRRGRFIIVSNRTLTLTRLKCQIHCFERSQ